MSEKPDNSSLKKDLELMYFKTGDTMQMFKCHYDAPFDYLYVQCLRRQ